MSKLTMAAAGTVGFLLGSRAGRGPYEWTTARLDELRSDPEVRRRAAEVRDVAATKAGDVAESAKATVDQATSGTGVATP